MAIRPKKTLPRRAMHISAKDGAHSDGPWSGGVSGAALDTDALILCVAVDPGDGPSWHVHPYDEIFIIQEGRARFTVGDEVIEAETGDIVMGPANVPHKYHNSGDGRLVSIDIHLNRTWIQTDLADPDA